MRFMQYFFGIVLAQTAMFTLILLNTDSLSLENMLRIVIPALLIALAIAFWFFSVAAHYSKDMLNKAKDQFLSEKEKIQINIQRTKDRVRKDAQKEIRNEIAKAHAKANFKVGASFATALGIGALFVVAQMMTAGLLLISTATGALGGYYLRGKRLKAKTPEDIEIQAIPSKPTKIKSAKKLGYKNA